MRIESLAQMCKMDSLFSVNQLPFWGTSRQAGRKVNLILSWGFLSPWGYGQRQGGSSVEHPQAREAVRRRAHLVCGRQFLKMALKDPYGIPSPRVWAEANNLLLLNRVRQKGDGLPLLWLGHKRWQHLSCWVLCNLLGLHTWMEQAAMLEKHMWQGSESCLKIQWGTVVLSP